MSRARQDDGVLERDCGSEPRVPEQLAEDIGCAARSDVPVLIMGGPEDGREIACAIDRRSGTPRGSVEVVDCRQGGAVTRLMDSAPRERGRASIVLLQEVHALSLNEQAEVDHRLEELRIARRSTGIRIMASSSAPLFERVQDGSFDERLYYRLNVIQLVA